MTVYDASGTRPKSGKQRAVKAKSQPSSSGSKRPVALLVVAVVIVFTAIAANVIPSLSSDAEATIPDQLIGVWITTEADYADRAFEISNTSVSFRTAPGEDHVTSHRIEALHQDKKQHATDYTIVYSNGLQFSFTYEKNADVIRFANQPEFFWSRQEGTTSR